MDGILEPFPGGASSFLDLGDLNEADFLNNVVSGSGGGGQARFVRQPLRGVFFGGGGVGGGGFAIGQGKKKERVPAWQKGARCMPKCAWICLQLPRVKIRICRLPLTGF